MLQHIDTIDLPTGHRPMRSRPKRTSKSDIRGRTPTILNQFSPGKSIFVGAFLFLHFVSNTPQVPSIAP